MTPLRRPALLGLAIVSALAAAACFPPVDFAALAWLAWAPWLAALATGPRLRDAALGGALHSMILHAAQSGWMVHVMRVHGGLSWPGSLGMYAFGLLTVAPYGIAVALGTAVIARRRGCLALLAAPLLSALVDVARTDMTLGHPWLLPGMTQGLHPVVLGSADVVGVHGLGAVILFGNAGIAAVALASLRREPKPRALAVAGVAATLVAAALVHGLVAERRHRAPEAWARAVDLGDVATAIPAWPEGAARVAILQGAQPQDVKVRSSDQDDLDLARVQLQLEQEALDRGAQVVGWAESAHPDTTMRMPWLLPSVQGQLRRAQPRVMAPEAIVGALVEERPSGAPARERTLTNSALLIDAGGRKGRYDKRRLVPFGEYLPWRPLFGWFPQIARLVGELTRGTSDATLDGAHGRYGAVVCYEVVLPQRVRAVTRSGADVLVNLTNDGWYAGTWMPEQHLRFAVMRAVETRRFMLRAANSGISAIVAPDGRIVGRMEEGRRGLLLGSFDRRTEVTGYVRWGDAPMVVLGCAAALWAVLEAIVSRRRGASRYGEPS